MDKAACTYLFPLKPVPQKLRVARDLEWNPLPQENHEEIRAITYPLEEALHETLKDYRCDPEAALALWIYARTQGYLR